MSEFVRNGLSNDNSWMEFSQSNFFAISIHSYIFILFVCFFFIYVAFFVYFEKIISFVITLVTEICAVKQIASPVMQHASLNHKNQLKHYGKQVYLLEVSIAVAGDKLWFLPLKVYYFCFSKQEKHPVQ